eukprot:gene1716-32601_t
MAMQYAPTRLSVPKGWEGLLTDFSRETTSRSVRQSLCLQTPCWTVLRTQPAEIYKFAAEYFRSKAGEEPADENDDEELGDMPLDYSDPALEDATVKIQASYRGYRTRKGLAAQSQSDATETSEETPMFEGTDEENQAAAKIQAGFRGSKVRKELAEDKKQKADQASIDAIDLHDPEVQAASLKIQAGFRGMQGRREAKALAAGGGGGDESADAVAAGAEEVNFEGTDEEHAAAAKIQAGFRGHQVRKDMAGKAEGGDAADAAPAEEVNFEGTDEEHAAAAKIQAGFRGHQVRKDMAGKAEGGDAAD